MPRLSLPYLQPIDPDSCVDKLACGIALYLAAVGVEATAALPSAIAILGAVQEFALRGADAAHYSLQHHLPRRRRSSLSGAFGSSAGACEDARDALRYMPDLLVNHPADGIVTPLRLWAAWQMSHNPRLRTRLPRLTQFGKRLGLIR